ncbi:hypothetical protein F5884DRAFT_877588 [Xylogone sp. PMI_703]|nr:hypothetical protein F5884DRAFT_877588 [Xylogone sp. PMI_703]
MKFCQGQTQSLQLLSFTFFLLSLLSAVAADDCQPSTWAAGAVRLRAAPTPTVTFNKSASVASMGDAQPGQINCRYWGSTYTDVNYYTCTQLADKYGITIDQFFMLNPELDPDCSNIQQNTDYCVDGFVEPVRSTDGLCGPPNNNATCLGTLLQCCNAATWKCGNSTADCAPGTCYEGTCAGDQIYSTDGTCGYQHGNRLCAGKWGSCCNMNGACGNGTNFCGTDVCQSGNCTVANPPPTGPPSWATGNTTDGTCGGPNYYTCNLVYGNCCNKDGQCGSLPSDCGAGCQPQFGNCSSVATSRTTSSTSKTTSTGKTTTTTTTTRLTTTTTTTTTRKTSTSTTSTITGIGSLPSCGQTCFNNMLGQYSSLGCSSPDPACLCENVNFGFGLRDCSNGACGTAVASTVIAFGSAYCSSALATATRTTTTTSTVTGIASLPSCGQTCFNNMLGQYSALGCASPDPACLCKNVNFGFGLRDCSNGACGTAVASTVIAFGSAYCSSALATATSTATSTVTGIAALPSCGQTCFNNMLAQYSALGCSSPDPRCLCENVNFGFGLRDCSNGACGPAVASTVIAFGSSYCASATAAPTRK